MNVKPAFYSARNIFIFLSKNDEMSGGLGEANRPGDEPRRKKNKIELTMLQDPDRAT